MLLDEVKQGSRCSQRKSDPLPPGTREVGLLDSNTSMHAIISGELRAAYECPFISGMVPDDIRCGELDWPAE